MPEEENDVSQPAPVESRQTHEPVAQKKPAKRAPARKAARPSVQLSVTEVQALMAALIDTDELLDVPAAVQSRLDAAGVAYLASAGKIYGVVLNPAEYDSLVAARK